MGRVMSLAINHEANSCSDSTTEDPMPCCDDVSQELKVEEITQVSFDFDSTPHLYQLTIIVWYVADFYQYHIDSKSPVYLAHSPPLPNFDLLTAHQVFLI